MRTAARFNIVFRRNDRAGQVTRPLKEQTGTLYIRITVGKKRVKFSLATPEIAYADWSAKKQRMLGNSPVHASINRGLVKTLATLADIHADLERQNRPVTAAALATRYKDYDKSPLSLLGIYAAFLAERQKLVGVEISAATHEIAVTRYNKLGKFLAATGQNDLRPEDFNANLADKYLHWLLLSEGLQRNVANKYVQMIAQVLIWAVRREYITKNPLAGYQYKFAEAKELTYLESEELEALSCFEFAAETLGKARDFFVFQCWTGLAYADLAALNMAAAVETHKGRRVLRIRRAKSTTFKGYECVIPLLPEAERILAHYQDKLPVFGNQYYNRALKQIGMMCGVEGFALTSHVGRKTAGTLFLNAGVPMEVVSKILGHSSVSQTEKIYAKILDKTVVDSVERAFGNTTAPAPGFEPEAEETRVIQFRFGA